jgi:hypothetical protein
MQIDWSNAEGLTQALDEAGIWPEGKTYALVALGRTFTANAPFVAAGVAPVTPLFLTARNAGTSSDVVGVLTSAIVSADKGTAFGGNLIARTDIGVRDPKLVGLELDVMPAAGVAAASGSGGLFINAFNSPVPGPAIQTGGVGGGTFNNGIVFYNIAGAGLAAGAGTTMASLVATPPDARFTTDAIALSSGHGVRLGRSRLSGDEAGLKVQTVGGSDLMALDARGNLSVAGSLIQRKGAPASPTAPCALGEQRWDENFEYRCIAPNRWKRTALENW